MSEISTNLASGAAWLLRRYVTSDRMINVGVVDRLSNREQIGLAKVMTDMELLGELRHEIGTVLLEEKNLGRQVLNDYEGLV